MFEVQRKYNEQMQYIQDVIEWLETRMIGTPE